jgi:hypothetical protein
MKGINEMRLSCLPFQILGENARIQKDLGHRLEHIGRLGGTSFFLIGNGDNLVQQGGILCATKELEHCVSSREDRPPSD